MAITLVKLLIPFSMMIVDSPFRDGKKSPQTKAGRLKIRNKIAVTELGLEWRLLSLLSSRPSRGDTNRGEDTQSYNDSIGI